MIVVLMGVCGSGKTAVGQALAADLGWPFFDGDDFHPPANVAKMAAATPLVDADRWPWLELLNGKLIEQKNAVLACSALKEVYRQRLSQGIADCRFVYLRGSLELIRSRLAERKHRYMPASLLESQFATIEPPSDAIAIDISAGIADCVEAISLALAARPPGEAAAQ